MCPVLVLSSLPDMTTPQDNDTTQNSDLTLEPETIDDLDPRGEDAIKGGKPECTRGFTGC